jgi:hypothetical protein
MNLRRNYLMNLKLIGYKGCHGCDLAINRMCCKRVTVPVSVTFYKDQFEFRNGNSHLTFAKGDIVEALAVMNNRKIYCIKCYSKHQPEMGYIYISLKYIKVYVPKAGVATHGPGISM